MSPTPVLDSGVATIDWSWTFWSSKLRKSTTTSARWAGPSRMSCRTTGWGSRPEPVPIWVIACPLERAKS